MGTFNTNVTVTVTWPNGSTSEVSRVFDCDDNPFLWRPTAKVTEITRVDFKADKQQEEKM